ERFACRVGSQNRKSALLIRVHELGVAATVQRIQSAVQAAEETFAVIQTREVDLRSEGEFGHAETRCIGVLRNNERIVGSAQPAAVDARLGWTARTLGSHIR